MEFLLRILCIHSFPYERRLARKASLHPYPGPSFFGGHFFFNKWRSMHDTETLLCECSGFQKTSKGRGVSGTTGFESSALPYSK